MTSTLFLASRCLRHCLSLSVVTILFHCVRPTVHTCINLLVLLSLAFASIVHILLPPPHCVRLLRRRLCRPVFFMAAAPMPRLETQAPARTMCITCLSITHYTVDTHPPTLPMTSPTHVQTRHIPPLYSFAIGLGQLYAYSTLGLAGGSRL